MTSFTGVNPGKHNLFDFKDQTRDLEGEVKYEMGSTTSRSMRAEPFWHILNRAGLSVGLVNVTMAYPIEEMDGHAIAGFSYPTEDEGLFYPPELEEEVRWARSASESAFSVLLFTPILTTGFFLMSSGPSHSLM